MTPIALSITLPMSILRRQTWLDGSDPRVSGGTSSMKCFKSASTTTPPIRISSAWPVIRSGQASGCSLGRQRTPIICWRRNLVSQMANWSRNCHWRLFLKLSANCTTCRFRKVNKIRDFLVRKSSMNSLSKLDDKQSLPKPLNDWKLKCSIATLRYFSLSCNQLNWLITLKYLNNIVL